MFLYPGLTSFLTSSGFRSLGKKKRRKFSCLNMYNEGLFPEDCGINARVMDLHSSAFDVYSDFLACIWKCWGFLQKASYILYVSVLARVSWFACRSWKECKASSTSRTIKGKDVAAVNSALPEQECKTRENASSVAAACVGQSAL